MIMLIASLFFSHHCFPVSNSVSAEERILFERFEKLMTGVRLSGFFTLDDLEQPPAKEIYEIQRVQKLGVGDLWIFTARIKYGKKDLTLPIPLPVKWAGKTPVISMQNANIPGLGTFSANVVIDGNKYAGTWSHEKRGGHLFGKIERIKSKSKN